MQQLDRRGDGRIPFAAFMHHMHHHLHSTHLLRSAYRSVPKETKTRTFTDGGIEQHVQRVRGRIPLHPPTKQQLTQLGSPKQSAQHPKTTEAKLQRAWHALDPIGANDLRIQRLSSKDTSDVKLRRVWRALDPTCSGFLSLGGFDDLMKTAVQRPMRAPITLQRVRLVLDIQPAHFLTVL